METVPCDLCGSNHYHVIFCQRDFYLGGNSTEEFQVVRCEGCQLLYLNPRPTELEIGQYYPEEYFSSPSCGPPQKSGRPTQRPLGKIKRWVMEDYYGYPSKNPRTFLQSIRKWLLFPEMAQRILRGKVILPYIGEGRLLDVGCGPGAALEMFKRQGWEVYGVEISQVAVAQARERVGDCIHLGSLEQCSYEEETFDVIVFHHSLEHMFSPVRVLRQASRFLKKDGMMVITVPNAGSLEARVFGRMWLGWDPPRHLYHFDCETLNQLLKQAGFSPVLMQTGKSCNSFMVSLDLYMDEKWNRRVRARKVIENFLVRPLTLLLGNVGYGGEITVFAVKNGQQKGIISNT